MQTIEVRGAALAVDDAGAGPAVIWGHGLTSSIEREDELPYVDIASLRQGHRVVRYDARGHGRSASTEDLAGYHWRELALDQLALADALGIDRYIAAGASMGTGTALHAAVLASERIRGLVLVIPPTAWETRAAQRDLYAAGAALIEAGRVDDFLAGLRATPPPDPYVADPGWHDRAERRLREADPVRQVRALRGAIPADLPDPGELARIGVPALILAWTGDPVHPVDTAQRLAELLPHADLRVASIRSQVDEWTGAVAGFLDTIG